MNIGLAIILLGMILIVFSVIVFILATIAKGVVKARGAGVIIIGPIPIVIGSDKEIVKWAIILTLAALIIFTFLTLIAIHGGGLWSA